MALDRKKARANKAAARAKFTRLDNLNKMLDAGEPVHKAKAAMNDTWHNRSSNNVSGTWNRKNSKPSGVTISKGD